MFDGGQLIHVACGQARETQRVGVVFDDSPRDPLCCRDLRRDGARVLVAAEDPVNTVELRMAATELIPSHPDRVSLPASEASPSSGGLH
jgi:hypothetical protein